jgi:hypothetical protein
VENSLDHDPSLDATRKAVATQTVEGFSIEVSEWQQWFSSGRLEEIWHARSRYGMSAGESSMPAQSWFWFNALPALAGLRLRKMPGYPLDNYCGLADSCTAADSSQAAAIKDINFLYFGT